MHKEEITFDKLSEAVAYLIKEVSELKGMVETKQTPQKGKRVPIEIEEACRLIMKAKPTVYALVSKGLILAINEERNFSFSKMN